MERIGRFLAGRAGYVGQTGTSSDRDRRVEAVVSRVDGLEIRASALEERSDNLEERVSDLERSDDAG